MKLVFLDVSRAYFHTDITTPTFVELPPELKAAHPNMCWKLRKAMYGTRAAAQSWSKEYTKTLKEFGFIQHLGSPCCFHLPAKHLRVVVHGDDFVSLGPESAIRWYREQMATKYEVKVRGIVGPTRHEGN